MPKPFNHEHASLTIEGAIRAYINSSKSEHSVGTISKAIGAVIGQGFSKGRRGYCGDMQKAIFYLPQLLSISEKELLSRPGISSGGLAHLIVRDTVKSMGYELGQLHGDPSMSLLNKQYKTWVEENYASDWNSFRKKFDISISEGALFAERAKDFLEEKLLTIFDNTIRKQILDFTTTGQFTNAVMPIEQVRFVNPKTSPLTTTATDELAPGQDGLQ